MKKNKKDNFVKKLINSISTNSTGDKDYINEDFQLRKCKQRVISNNEYLELIKRSGFEAHEIAEVWFSNGRFYAIPKEAKMLEMSSKVREDYQHGASY